MSDCWGQHWGEIAPLPDVGSGIAAVERAEITATQSLSHQSLNFESIADKRHNTSEGSDNICHTSDIPIGNPLVLHTIKLLEFSRKLNDNNNGQKLSRESVPQLVTNNEMKTKESNLFWLRNRNLNEKGVKKLLRRAVITLIVFHGYQFTNQSVIDLLVDILSQYLWRLCQTIRTTTDSLELMSSNDFIDVIDRVFHDMNVSDFESLRQYESDLQLYNQNLIKEINKKIGFNESINNCNKIKNNYQMDSKCDHLDQSSATTQSEAKGIDTTLSLKSLLSSFKTNNTEESEQLFDLSSLTNTCHKSTES